MSQDRVNECHRCGETPQSEVILDELLWTNMSAMKVQQVNVSLLLWWLDVSEVLINFMIWNIKARILPLWQKMWSMCVLVIVYVHFCPADEVRWFLQTGVRGPETRQLLLLVRWFCFGQRSRCCVCAIRGRTVSLMTDMWQTSPPKLHFPDATPPTQLSCCSGFIMWGCICFRDDWTFDLNQKNKQIKYNLRITQTYKLTC